MENNMNVNIRFDLPKSSDSAIKVIGVGGGGSNAVNHMFRKGIRGVDFIVCNTDMQALDISPVPVKIKLGATLTGGRGAGAKPEIGRSAALENLEDLKAALGTNTSMVFITAGMGGGTGTGAAPVIAQTIRDMGILTVAIVTIPFIFEGPKRRQQAEAGLNELRSAVDTMLVIKNERIREMYRNLAMSQAFSHADEVLCTAAKGIAEIITRSGIINVDMNDVNTVMRESGVAIMGSAQASGEGRALTAVTQALESPLLNDNEITGAKDILLYITLGNEDVSTDECITITELVNQRAGGDANMIWGYAIDKELGADIGVTVIATGFGNTPIDTGLPSGTVPKTITIDTAQLSPISVPMTGPLDGGIKKPEFFQPAPSPAPSPEPPAEVREFTLLDRDAAERAALKIDEVSPVSETPSTGTFKFIDITDKTEPDTSLKFEDIPSTEADPVIAGPSREMTGAMQRERENRLREMTIKIRTAGGLEELESEPAYKRLGIKLDDSTSSSDRLSPEKIVVQEKDLSGRTVPVIKANPFFGDQPD